MIIKLCFILSTFLLCFCCVSAGEYGLPNPDVESADKNVDQNLMKKLEKLMDEKIFDLQNAIVSKLEAITGLQYDMQRDIKVLKDKTSEPTINLTQITELAAKETQILDSIKQINSKLVVVENVPDQIQNNTATIQRLWDDCEKRNTSTERTPQAHGLGTNTSESVTKPTISISKYLRLDSGERHDLRGTVDKLDRSMISSTKCKYMEFERGRGGSWFSNVFDGKAFEAHFAIRTASTAKITLRGKEDATFNFLIGVDINFLTIFEQTNPFAVSTRFTPKILSKDYYVQFYIKIKEETLTFGKKCDSKPLFTTKATISKGDVINFFFDTGSVFGAKVLYKCPVNVACNTLRIPMSIG